MNDENKLPSKKEVLLYFNVADGDRTRRRKRNECTLVRLMADGLLYIWQKIDKFISPELNLVLRTLENLLIHIYKDIISLFLRQINCIGSIESPGNET
ncbi:hypothetical protein Trydic_g19212 [Trypoxylus dichotomus]